MALGMHYFLAIDSGISAPQIREFDMLRVTSFYVRFFSSCNSLQPKPLNGS